MKILKLKVANILSIEEAEIEFKDNGLVLVEGWNHDDGRANGAGKTALFNALSFAIYGKIPRKITATEITRKGSKKSLAEVDIQVGDDIYSVRRERPRGLAYFLNGEKIDITQEGFEDKLGLGYSQFIVTMYTAQQTDGKFINLNDSGKKDFILQLMNLSYFSACKKETDKVIKQLSVEINDENVKIQNAKSKIEVYEEYTDDIGNLKNSLDNYEKSLKTMSTEVDKFRAVEKPDVSKFTQLDSQLNSRLSKVGEAKINRRHITDAMKKIHASIKQLKEAEPDIMCPHCDGGLSISNNSVMAFNDENNKSEIMRLTEDFKKYKEQVDELDMTINDEENLKNLIAKSKEKQSNSLKEYHVARDRVKEIELAMYKTNQAITSCKDKIEKTEEAKKKITSLKKNVEFAFEAVSRKREELDMFKVVSDMFAPTGAPAYIMDSILNVFNELVSEHVSLVWPNANYRLQAYKENKSGDVVAKFSETLTMNGRQVSIGSLSGGEFRALSLAIDFALIDVLAKQFGRTMNPIIMDEPFEGLDSIGREIVIELLEKLSVNRQIFVIDHASEAKAMFSDIIKIEKKNGKSNIVR